MNTTTQRYFGVDVSAPKVPMSDKKLVELAAACMQKGWTIIIVGKKK